VTVQEKVGWVRAAAVAAGRDPDALELTTLTFVVAITDDPSGIRAALAKGSPMTPEQIADCPLFITGSPAEIRDTLERRRERTGISYVVIQGKDPALLGRFAEAVVEPLAGK
jgi:alkanesulfonate monooxygenase SsuD/methylene tetrahydromethanopterin reductase-like flavin-dependent oxidoreductase (luciferase family)